MAIGGELSCRDIYTKLLHKFGKLLGIWKSVESPYGGIYLVSFNPSNNAIYGYEVLAPKGYQVQDKLRKKLIFTVKIHQDTGLAIPQCHRGYEGPHDCSVSVMGETLCYRCSWG